MGGIEGGWGKCSRGLGLADASTAWVLSAGRQCFFFTFASRTLLMIQMNLQKIFIGEL